MNAEIIAIGTELLLGEILDTNSRHIARALRDLGLDLYWTSSVGDNVERIVEAVARALGRSTVVITTGGLGPTVDDPTREGVARALGRELEFRPELWEQIIQRFARWGRRPTENNRRQAYLPAGALAIENPVGTAPAFSLEAQDGRLLFCLPGVPAEMEHLLNSDVLPALKRRLSLTGIIQARTLRTSGLGESQLDEKIGDLERLNNPSVGLAAHSGVVDIRITAKAGNPREAAQMISGVEATLRDRLGTAIFGADDDLLEGVVLRLLEALGWNLAVVEAGTGGRLSGRLAATGSTAFAGGLVLRSLAGPDLEKLLAEYASRLQAHSGIGLRVTPGENGRTDLTLVLQTPRGQERVEQGYGGPFPNAGTWAANLALNRLRLLLEGAKP